MERNKFATDYTDIWAEIFLKGIKIRAFPRITQIYTNKKIFSIYRQKCIFLVKSRLYNTIVVSENYYKKIREIRGKKNLIDYYKIRNGW